MSKINTKPITTIVGKCEKISITFTELFKINLVRKIKNQVLLETSYLNCSAPKQKKNWSYNALMSGHGFARVIPG